MSAVVLIVVLIGVCMCIALGVVRIGVWLIDRREQDRTRVIRDAAFVAQVRAELFPDKSRLRLLEIEASKRGDLIAAAQFAEQAEVRNA